MACSFSFLIPRYSDFLGFLHGSLGHLEQQLFQDHRLLGRLGREQGMGSHREGLREHQKEESRMDLGNSFPPRHTLGSCVLSWGEPAAQVGEWLVVP